MKRAYLRIALLLACLVTACCAHYDDNADLKKEARPSPKKSSSEIDRELTEIQ